MTERALVVVRTFLNNVDAELARSALEAAEIESLIQADDCGGVRPHLWMGGVELLVAAEDAAQAEEVLSAAVGEIWVEPGANDRQED
jgi:hypothetical protein